MIYSNNVARKITLALSKLSNISASIKKEIITGNRL